MFLSLLRGLAGACAACNACMRGCVRVLTQLNQTTAFGVISLHLKNGVMFSLIAL